MTGPLTPETIAAALGERERAVPGEPAWLREARRAGLARFAARGLPSTREEDWKYTSLAPLREVAFEVNGHHADAVCPEAAALARRVPGLPAWPRLVFVDGRHVQELSTAPPAGVQLGSLAERAVAAGAGLRPYLGEAAGQPGAFADLNAALWADGAFLDLGRGAAPGVPVLLVFVASGAGAARADHLRNLLVLAAGSRATVVECHLGLAAGPRLTNAVTRVALGEGAELDHYLLQLEGPQAFHVSRLQATLARDSQLASCAVAFGARLARLEVEADLGAEGAACTLSGLAVLGGRQHLDVHTLVDHRAPRATSRQLYKGILDGQARGVFDGRVVVRRGADGTDAQQTNKNLLLGEGVEVDSKPQLEIFADDVKCSHGAADGQLAPEAIFYLRSRGLGKAAARSLLTYGFAAEVLARVRVGPLREWLETKLAGRLSGGHVVEEAA